MYFVVFCCVVLMTSHETGQLYNQRILQCGTFGSPGAASENFGKCGHRTSGTFRWVGWRIAVGGGVRLRSLWQPA